MHCLLKYDVKRRYGLLVIALPCEETEVPLNSKTWS